MQESDFLLIPELRNVYFLEHIQDSNMKSTLPSKIETDRLLLRSYREGDEFIDIHKELLSFEQVLEFFKHIEKEGEVKDYCNGANAGGRWIFQIVLQLFFGIRHAFPPLRLWSTLLSYWKR